MLLREYLTEADLLTTLSACIAHKPGRTNLGERICVRCGEPLPKAAA